MSQAQRIVFVLDDLFTPETRAMSDEVLGYLLTALTAIDVAYLKAFPKTPLLYEAGIVYQEEPPGAEDWANIPMIRKLGWGDCLPLDTKVVRASDLVQIPIAHLVPGDVILGDGGPTTVMEGVVTGKKEILEFSLSNGRTLRCSPEHRLLQRHGTEMRARDASVGDELLSPSESPVAILAVELREPELCGDITTDSGRFYLPEADVFVHNCEELACWRAAELQVRNIGATAAFSKQEQPDGTMLYHIVVQLPDGRVEDPSRQLGMR